MAARKQEQGKICELCGKTFFRSVFKNKMESHAKFEGRRFCSQSCGSTATRLRKPDPVKNCQKCGVLLIRRRMPSGVLEDFGAFNRRKFCSRSCGNSRTPTDKSRFGHQARKFRKDACEACGQTKSLQAHHVDRDISNNTAENIQTLCMHCHQFFHRTADRLKWEGEIRMPKLR